MVEFGFEESEQKLPENYEKVLFYETNIEESNIKRKPLIWSQDMIITKFAHTKKKGEFGSWKSVRKLPKN